MTTGGRGDHRLDQASRPTVVEMLAERLDVTPDEGASGRRRPFRRLSAPRLAGRPTDHGRRRIPEGDLDVDWVPLDDAAVPQSEGAHLTAVPVAAVGRAVRDRRDAKLRHLLAEPIGNLEKQVEPAGLDIRPGEEDHRSRETVETSEAAEIPTATLGLRDLRLGRVPLEVEGTADDGRVRRPSGEAAAQLRELPARAGEDGIRLPRPPGLHPRERRLPFAGQVEDEQTPRQRLPEALELANRGPRQGARRAATSRGVAPAPMCCNSTPSSSAFASSSSSQARLGPTQPMRNDCRSSLSAADGARLRTASAAMPISSSISVLACAAGVAATSAPTCRVRTR